MHAAALGSVRISLIVALGGFLMGFDASVISGVLGFIETEFDLDALQLGWAVASLALTSTFAMMAAGPISDRFGRRQTLRVAAALFLASALLSALAPDYLTLVMARMLGGLGVGAALIIAPMYIAEIAAAEQRGRLVSINQLNIVVGISAAFFSNYLILNLAASGSEIVASLGLDAWSWRWMLGVEAVPAAIYLFALLFVPESPRWLMAHGDREQALAILTATAGPEQARSALQSAADHDRSGSLGDLIDPRLRRVLIVGVTIAVLQQITGINAVFFYAPMIFEQTGIGTDAAFLQAVLVGLTNLAFTIVAMLCIDRLGRRPLLLFGVAGVAASMLLLSWGFASASYRLPTEAVATLSDPLVIDALADLAQRSWANEIDFRDAMRDALGPELFVNNEAALLRAAIVIDPTLILFGILAFVASFAVSLGPVMWVLFSELFPNHVRGYAISFVGLVNSSVSFGVQLLFPWELEHLGSALTFLGYGVFACVGLLLVFWLVPETRNQSLEDLEARLGADAPTAREALS